VRVGVGFDAHPFVDGRPLKLGGVAIAHPRGLGGHSDGDALLHAIADALLGAAGRGTLGEHFPDASDAWRGAESSVLLARVAGLVGEAGFRLGNLDAVVIAESPRIAPVAAAMRVRVAEVLGVEPGRVSVRGTSSNGIGFSGRGEGIAVVAVALLEDL
jgi:2-C-methyl-D-erythritol 2,4-cyclodiphosphate synthase